MSYKVYFVDKKHKGKKVKVSVAKSKEEFKNTTVKELKTILNIQDNDHDLEISTLLYRDQPLEDERTLGSYGIKHKAEICRTVRWRSGVFFCIGGSYDDVSRTESMDQLALMNKNQCCVQ